MLFVNITKNLMELCSYESEKEFADLLMMHTATHQLYPQNEEGFVHGICWLYESEHYVVDHESIEFLPYYDAYCVEDGTHTPGSYLKYKHVGSDDYCYSMVLVDQEEARRLVRCYRDRLFGNPEKRAMRRNAFASLFPDSYQQFAAEAHDGGSKDNVDGTTTYILYDESYNILCSCID